jgi:hypothetical protein
LAKVSKGDVLNLAKNHIERLERARDELQDDRSSLQDDVHDTEDACVAAIWREGQAVD